jgi:hypothetical protein
LHGKVDVVNENDDDDDDDSPFYKLYANSHAHSNPQTK